MAFLLARILFCFSLSFYLFPRLSLSLQLTASGDTTVHLWDVVGGASLASFRAHSGSVKSVDVKADESGMCSKHQATTVGSHVSAPVCSF